MSPSDPMSVFDRRLVRAHRDRAAATLAAHDFLLADSADALVERLHDVRRDFPAVLDLGCRTGLMAARLRGRKGIRTLLQADISVGMAGRARANGLPALVADEEMLPVAAGSLDLVVSNLSLHWVNDLPGALLQVRQALRPDGLFVATLLGGDTLHELRSVIFDAELAVAGGVSPRMSPLTDVRDAGALLQRAGFALPVADADRFTVTYADAFGLFADLRGMGETAANRDRNPHTPSRSFWPEVARLYAERYAEPDGRIPATFQVITVTGWAPHPAQQKALRPGSARQGLAAALGTEEKPAGDKVKPG